MSEKLASYDVVIAGGGICGLLVGTLLQKAGKSVLILEKQAVAGGKFSELNWEGVKYDHFGKWETINGSANPEDGVFYRMCKQAGLKLEPNIVHWQVGLITTEKDHPEYRSISDWSKGKSLIDFAAAVGVAFDEEQKKELIATLEKMASFSYEQLMGMTSVTLEQWLEENVKDEIIKTSFSLGSGVTDTPAKDAGFAHYAWTQGNLYKGKSVFVTFKGGSEQKIIVQPLIKIAEKAGAVIKTNTTVRDISVNDKQVEGVWYVDNTTGLAQKVLAKNVVMAIPVYDAFPSVLKENMLTPGELGYVKSLIARYSRDLSCYFLLEKDAIKHLPGHFHGYDLTSGMPVYMGEIVQQKYFGAEVPKNRDYLQIYIPGGRSGFGYLNYEGSPNNISYDLLEATRQKMLAVVDKYMVPGFASKVVKSGICWSPNYGRYSGMAYDSNLGVKSEAIKGLFFASDSVDCTCIGTLGTEKSGTVVMRCVEAMLKDKVTSISAQTTGTPVSSQESAKKQSEAAEKNVSTLTEAFERIKARYQDPKIRESLADFNTPVECIFAAENTKAVFLINGDKGIEIKANTGDDSAPLVTQYESEQTLIDICNKKLGAMGAYTKGKLKVVKGDMKALMKLRKLMFP